MPSFALVTAFIEKQHQDAADGEKDAKSGVDKVQAYAGGQNDGRYGEVLCGMDLFQFDFHN